MSIIENLEDFKHFKIDISSYSRELMSIIISRKTVKKIPAVIRWTPVNCKTTLHHDEGKLKLQDIIMMKMK